MNIRVPEIEKPYQPVHKPVESKVTVSITDFGAKPDNSLCTKQIQNAINHIHNIGSGTLIIPKGTWKTGALKLCSNLIVHFEDGATILGSDNFLDYGSGKWNEAIFTAIEQHNIIFRGNGTINGSDCFNPHGESGNRGPHGFWLERCSNFIIQNLTLKNIGNWGFAIWNSCDLSFISISVLGGHDGIDLQSSRRIIIHNCNFQTGDDNLAGPGNFDISISNSFFNSSCNNIRLSSHRLHINQSKFEGPGKYEHRFNNRFNTLCSIVHFSPAERNFKGFTPHSDQWLVENSSFSDIDALFEYDNGHAWQDSRPFGTILFRNISCSGFIHPVIAHCSMRSLNSYRRECRLFFENCTFTPRTGHEDCTFFDLKRHGCLVLRNVSLLNNASTHPIKACDGGPVIAENLKITTTTVKPASTTEEALRGASSFIFETPPLPDDFGSPPIHQFPQLKNANFAGKFRDDNIRAFIYTIQNSEAILLKALKPASVEARGLIYSIETNKNIKLNQQKNTLSHENRTKFKFNLNKNDTALILGIGIEIATD